MNSKIIVFVFALGAILGTAWVLQPFQAKDPNAQLIVNENPKGGNFTLISNKGPVQLADFKGKLVLLYFGYTYCPDICPTDLGNLSIAYQQLSDTEKSNLQILFISVDPQRDTPKRLQEYSDYFDANIIGLTSSPETIAKIARQYGVVYAKAKTSANDQNYAVDHSAFTYLVDPQGNLQQQLPHATAPNLLIKTIRQHLKKYNNGRASLDSKKEIL